MPRPKLPPAGPATPGPPPEHSGPGEVRRPDDASPTGREDETRVPPGRPWYLVPIGIIIVVLVALAG
ncbi:MAG: hypothetical protein L3J73_04630, partial [Thermoplasmata archaeon]|nr:hypothetical protein [Thermoplasmata archaeon]